MSWARRILRVDLTKGTCTAEPLNMEWARAYIGSRGLATKYFASEVDAKVDPLSPTNKIIWATGPLTGETLSLALQAHCSRDHLYFYDAIIPDGSQPLGGFQENLREVDLETGAERQRNAAIDQAEQGFIEGIGQGGPIGAIAIEQHGAGSGFAVAAPDHGNRHLFAIGRGVPAVLQLLWIVTLRHRFQIRVFVILAVAQFG